MAYPMNDFSLTVLMNQRTQQYLHQAELDHLANECNPHGEPRLSRQARRLAGLFGQALTNLGEQFKSLERVTGAS